MFLVGGKIYTIEIYGKKEGLDNNGLGGSYGQNINIL